MANSLTPNDIRSGQLIDEVDGTPYQSCSLSYEARVGPVLSVPYVRGADQFSTTESWFEKEIPSSLIYEDNLGAVTLTGLKVRSTLGHPYVLGRLRADVTFFGQPRELKDEYRIASLCSRIDGLDYFASFNSVNSVTEPTESGEKVIATVEASESITGQHGGFQFLIRATTPWTSTKGQSFEVQAGATLETISTEGATAEEHLTAQWPIRALLVLAYGKELYWRRHHVLDDQFPAWAVDGYSHGRDECIVLFRRTVEDSEQPEPPRSEVTLPTFHLADIGAGGLMKWLSLYEDPIFRRSIEPVVEVINGASRFIEPQVLMAVLGLDALGYYHDSERARGVALYKQIERCIKMAKMDLKSIGTDLGIAKAIARVNNDLKHPDRLQRPDPIHMTLVANLSISLMRMQLFTLLDLPESKRTQYAGYGSVRHSLESFKQVGLKVDSEGKFIPRSEPATA